MRIARATSPPPIQNILRESVMLAPPFTWQYGEWEPAVVKNPLSHGEGSSSAASVESPALSSAHSKFALGRGVNVMPGGLLLRLSWGS